jgi:hypothetical protein
MDAEEARSSFLETHPRYTGLNEAWLALRSDLNDRYTKECRSVGEKLFKTRRTNKALELWSKEPWTIYLLQRPYKDEYNRGGLHVERERHWLKYQLDKLAADAAVHRGTERVVLERIWLSSYSSQGFGMQNYARRAAELKAAEAAPYCDTEIVEDVSKSAITGKPNLYAYVVMALVEHELDAEIVRRKPGMDLRDWLKWCWKNGVNPRVYNPFLPHGLEEKLGITYFGDDVKEKIA